MEVALQLLSGHQLAGATAAAMAVADLRLATLVAVAGRRSANRETIERQLDVWRGESYDAKIHSQRLAVYRLLAGRVEDVQVGGCWRLLLMVSVYYSSRDSVFQAFGVWFQPIAELLLDLHKWRIRPFRPF